MEKGPKVAVEVANRLRRRIVTGEVSVGDSLPSEASLLEEFGVSRPSMRAALRILESEDLVTMRRGSRGGAWVNAPTDDALTRRAGAYLQFHNATLNELHAARLVIEPPAVSLLAARSDPNDAAALRELTAREEAVLRDRSAFALAALAFHRRIVELSGNPMLTLFSSMVHGVLEAQAAIAAGTPPGRWIGASATHHAEHLRLIELVEAGATAEAEARWRVHLSQGGETERQSTARINLSR